MAQSSGRGQRHVEQQRHSRSSCRLCCHGGGCQGISVRIPSHNNATAHPGDSFRQDSEIRPRLVSELFPTLVDIASRMMQTPPSAAQEIPTMLHLIIKAYKTSISVELSPHQQTAGSIMPWGQLLFNVVNLTVPQEAVPEDEEDRESCEWWKAKKWAYAVLGNLFHRCAFTLAHAHSIDLCFQLRQPLSAAHHAEKELLSFLSTFRHRVCP